MGKGKSQRIRLPTYGIATAEKTKVEQPLSVNHPLLRLTLFCTFWGQA